MRSNTVKIDQTAFNRGVNEVLQLKPLGRIMREIGTMVGHSGKHEENSAPKRRDIAPTKPVKR